MLSLKCYRELYSGQGLRTFKNDNLSVRCIATYILMGPCPLHNIYIHMYIHIWKKSTTVAFRVRDHSFAFGSDGAAYTREKESMYY